MFALELEAVVISPCRNQKLKVTGCLAPPRPNMQLATGTDAVHIRQFRKIWRKIRPPLIAR